MAVLQILWRYAGLWDEGVGGSMPRRHVNGPLWAYLGPYRLLE